MAVEKRNVIFLAIVLEIEGREDITLDISTPDSRKKLSENPVTLKEGATYQLKIVFRVRLDVIRGLNYLEEKKRQGILIEKSETLMVSSDVIVWIIRN
jgi:Rho GDP-dissociation inhibitor